MAHDPNGRLAPGGFGRRTFLKAAAGAAAVLLVDRAFEFDAHAQQSAGYQFFNRADAEILEALAERIWPADDEHPGAREAGALAYIDQALVGSYAGYGAAYRTLLRDLRQRLDQLYDRPVGELDAKQLDALLTELEEQGATGIFAGGPPEDAAAGVDRGDPTSAGVGARQMQLGLGPGSAFAMFRRHVMEGVLSDPVHGGNRDFAGWRALGYPGAHYVYTAEEQQVTEPLEKPIQSVADL